MPDSIEFTKRVDDRGRVIVPNEIREALSIDGREALVKFEAQKIQYLDDEDDGNDK